MRGFFALLLIAGILGLMLSTGNASGKADDLPPHQKTAIHAPAVATRSAGVVAAQNADAQAAAFEQESARVYAQAQERQGAEMRMLATQEAAVATQAANDNMVSREYATLIAVQIDATRQAITQTMEQNRQAYAATLVSIDAEKKTAVKRAVDVAESDSTDKSVGTFWKWFWPVVAAAFAFLLFISGLRLSGLIKRKDDDTYEEPAPYVPQVQWNVKPAPPAPPVDIDKARAVMAAYNLALRYVEDSIRENGGKAVKMLTAPEWDQKYGVSRDNHGIAVGYLRDRGMIRTQNGGRSDDQGTFVQESGKDLVYILRVLSTTPPPSA